MDNFDLKKYISEGKIHLQEAVVDRTQFTVYDYKDPEFQNALKDVEKTNGGVFELETFTKGDNGDMLVDLNAGKYHDGTQEVMYTAAEQGHQWEDVEDYFNAVEGHEEGFKEYPNELSKIPDEVLSDEISIYGEDYGQFYGGDRDDYYQE